MSPTPVSAKPIKITVTSGKKGQPITVRNRNTGEIQHLTLGDTAKAIVDLQNFTNGYTEGDVIEFVVSGEVMGSSTITASGDAPQSVTVGTSSITTGVSRGM